MFREGLSQDERYLSTRLESLVDIVFGFALSLSALQLTVPEHAADLIGHPYRWALYGITFSLVVAYWLRCHNIMSIGFRPLLVDLVMLFAYLASISLLPFALISFSRLLAGTAVDRQAGFGLYAAIVLAIAATGFVLQWRGLRRAYADLDAGRRANAWRSMLRAALSVVMFGLALLIDALDGITWAWVPFLALAPAIRLAQWQLHGLPERLFGRGTSAPPGVS